MGDRLPVGFTARVMESNPAHAKVNVWAGRGEGHRALAGTLTLRTEEVGPFFSMLNGYCPPEESWDD
jgi:hypothetical protein